MNKTVEFIVCPVDKAQLKAEGDYLMCTKCGAKYKVNEGIPDLIPEEKEEKNPDSK